MDLRRFVTDNQQDWELLESYLNRVGSRGLSSLGPDELRELGVLHRKVAADLASARSAFGPTKVVHFLNSLALRSHNAVYRAPRRSPAALARELWRGIPAAVARHAGALLGSTLLFSTGALVGALGSLADVSVAEMILGPRWVESVQNGEYWVESVFAVAPHSLVSAGILTNNLSVAIVVFAVGCTGVLPAYLLFTNGTMLGSVLVLCAQYDLLPRFLPFVAGHGVIEISAILVAGAGAFVVFDGWLHPGDRTRAQGFRAGAREGLMVAAAAVPALLIAAPVEGLISPVEAVPPLARLLLGLSLGLAYWTWLYGGRRAGTGHDSGRDQRKGRLSGSFS